LSNSPYSSKLTCGNNALKTKTNGTPSRPSGPGSTAGTSSVAGSVIQHYTPSQYSEFDSQFSQVPGSAMEMFEKQQGILNRNTQHYNMASGNTSSFNTTSGVSNISSHLSNISGSSPINMASLSIHKQRLLDLCRKHDVDLRTIEWFVLPEHAVYWDTLGRKLEEIDRRSKLGDGNFKVKNPSAWLTKFFNTIRKGNGGNIGNINTSNMNTNMNSNMNTPPQHSSGLNSGIMSPQHRGNHGGYNTMTEKYNSNVHQHHAHSSISNASTTHTSNVTSNVMQPRSLEESISGAVKQGLSLPQESI
jgi:hypothetical protein